MEIKTWLVATLILKEARKHYGDLARNPQIPDIKMKYEVLQYSLRGLNQLEIQRNCQTEITN